MIAALGDNIVCGLGFSSEEVYASVKKGIGGVKRYEGTFGLPDPFMASLIADEALDSAFADLGRGAAGDYTKFEKAIILSASKAIAQAGIDASHKRVLFILSTTKGNVDLLEHENYDRQKVTLWHSAGLLAG